MSNDLIARLREPSSVRNWHEADKQREEAADALTEMAVVVEQRNSLRAALIKVLDTHKAEAKAAESYRNIAENCTDVAYACIAHGRAMFAAMDAEREARILLLTLKDAPNTVNKEKQNG